MFSGLLLGEPRKISVYSFRLGVESPVVRNCNLWGQYWYIFLIVNKCIAVEEELDVQVWYPRMLTLFPPEGL